MPRALRDLYPGLVCDLDGVVYRGADAVPYAVEGLSEVASTSPGGVVYATNNASRPPEQVAEQLRSLGLAVSGDHVVNSSVAGAQVLAGRLAAGSPVLAVGGGGVADALRGAGLSPVLPSEVAETIRPVKAVLQGYGPDVRASDLAEVAYAVQSGADWVVTNADRTLPTDRGIAPGNGSLVNAVRSAVDIDPEIVGKPGPLMYQMAAQRLGTDPEHTLGIGDRLETDIAGAHAAGMDSLLVFTGVHGVADVVAADRHLRPRYVAGDLRSLGEVYDEPVADGAGWRVGGLVGALETSAQPNVRFQGSDDGAAQGQDGLRIALHVLWAALDDGRISLKAAVSATQRWQ
ncbi:HAD-IIA family hydrolase [Allobranchiibius sp. GilTou38]|uniref:HAD-IIA family hydrolase n=1 Tax=Allobranchiibius sp. GilTou38 TaxID=2815210 RepID=UPI001AA0C897|nr:HAD-IIA family hydrolase [Allobranchiibius sp. GilTou38]MBO1766205.1 HAD-IIA family hydrolase [Allobranchiibius sp. GilTou38]